MNNTFQDWKREVDRVLWRIYAINIADAGFDDAYLADRYRSGFTPNELVSWLGQKFDLIAVSASAYR